MSNFEKIQTDIRTAEVLFPSYENAYALAIDDRLPINNILIGLTNPFPSYKVRRRLGGKFFLMEYVLEGEGVFQSNGKSQKLKAGDLFFIAKGEPHDFRSDEKNPLKKIWISFDSEYFGEMLKGYRVTTGVYRAKVKNYFLSLYNIASIDESPSQKFFAIAENLHAIALQVARCAVAENSENADTIKNELLASVYTQKSLDDIAAALFMSKSNLIRVFKRSTGVTPYRFITGEKIKIAQNLLSTTSMHIKNIAEVLSFPDEHYFSFFFKQKTGITPTEYRRSFN